jgi:putative ABC transport system permease protein
MLPNHLKIALRSLLYNKGYSTITIFGLSLGLAVSLLCYIYIQDELSYDHFHEKSELIYRINSDITYSGKTMQGASSPTPMGETLKKDFPEIEAFTRLGKYGSQLVKSERAVAREQTILYADSTVFDVFTLPFIAGNPNKSLTDPTAVVITRRMAIKYFGTTDALNRILHFDNGEARRITGVMENLPKQSHFHADFLLPVYQTKDAKANKWGNHIFSTYLLLQPGADPNSLHAKFEKVLQTYMDPALRQYFQTTLAETRKAGNNFSYSLMPLRAIHLHSNREGELSPNGSMAHIYIFMMIGFSILLIAIFNFINLTTARSSKRAQEIGVRKVMGSTRSVLVLQFLSESMLITFLALVVGVTLVYSLLPAFNTLAAKELSFPDLISVQTVCVGLAGTALVGLLAGTYPAFYLASFQPVNALKGSLKLFNNRQGLRSYLVIFQFSMSVLLMIGTLLVNQQLDFIRTKRVGFDKEQVLVVKTGQSTASDLLVFKNEVLQNPLVKTGTVSGFLPVTSQRWNDMWFAQQTDQKFAVNMQEWMVDADYLQTLNLALVQGRNFKEGSNADLEGVIINESAAKRFGYENPVGKTIHKTGDEKAVIIGVVRDFHYESLRTKIEPLGLFISSAALGPGVEKAALEAVSFKIDAKNVTASLHAISKTWKKVVPGKPFEFTFLSEDFDAMYRAEQCIEGIFTAFASIAMLIACLGLFGLSAFSAEQRTKEIGVRKVLGASVASITRLLSKDFLKPVLIAIAIASPVGWYVMDLWLQDFVYKVEMQWWVFVLAGVITVAIALITVSFHSLKSAWTNPVKSLKSS